MALLYDAILSPSKLEILQSWVPTRPWFSGSEVAVVDAYRFDDPADEVGIEVHLISSHGRVFQVPLTYRGAPLAGAEPSLITTMEHSVLGTRWVYDGAADPVFAQALATAMLTGGRQADLEFATPVPDSVRAVTTRVLGSGEPGTPVPRIDAVSFADDISADVAATIISADGLALRLLREVGVAGEVDGGHERPTLIGRWPGQKSPALLAAVD